MTGRQGETLVMHGVVRGLDGKPICGAIVEVWHANTKGFYSFFDNSQSKYNLRRRIETGADGRYGFRTIIPAGYGCPPNGPTQRLLNQLGRHGQRPAHIHFFVSRLGYRDLTSQINILTFQAINICTTTSPLRPGRA
jgi:catechol 1,2-dioxygenase